MFRPRVIPTLLLKGSGLVKTKQFAKPRYIGDPINAVRIFNELQVDELVLLDIAATVEKRSISTQIVTEMGDEAYMPFAVGGGISSVEKGIELIKAGAEKVIINTAFITNPKLVPALASALGTQSVVVSLDIKKNWRGKYEAWTHAGRQRVKVPITDLARRAQEDGAGEILINSITNDGLMGGYDLTLIKIITESVNIPVISIGGAGKLEDFKSAILHGAHAVAAGSFFIYHGARNAVLINYPDQSELLNTFL